MEVVCPNGPKHILLWQVDDGLFNVILGSQIALPDSIFAGDDRYLGITVSGDPEILPRTLLTSVPKAAYAKHGGGWIEDYGNQKLYTANTDVNVGINNDDPWSTLSIGSNILGGPGDYITIGNPDEFTGIVLGEEINNFGYMRWNHFDHQININSRDDGQDYLGITIDHNKVGIGTPNPSQELHVVGDICYTGSIGACSDARYKTNIREMYGSLDKVTRLRGVTYKWKQSEFPELKFSDNNQVGLIAQDVQEIIPEIVSEDDKGYLNIDYAKLTSVLVGAIKEQQKQIETLSRRVDELEGTKISSR